MHARRAMEAPLSPLKLDTVTFSIADGTGSPEEGNTVMEVISWRPRAVLLHSFLAPKMCDYLVEASVPKMGVSKVGSESTVGGEKSKDRDSTSTWIGARLAVLDPVFSRMRRRAALFAAIPETHQVCQHCLPARATSSADHISFCVLSLHPAGAHSSIEV